MSFPYHMRYSLTRWQRLVPHIILWHIFGPLGVFVCSTTFLFGLTKNAWNLLLFTFCIWSLRGYIIGFVGILFDKEAEVDIVIEPLGIGYLVGKERNYIFMDGVTSVRSLSKDTWTITHFNGTVLIVPKHLMPEECLTHIRNTIRGGSEYLSQFRTRANGERKGSTVRKAD